MMDHPAIARVTMRGHGSCGRPYFVMERVRGVPILEHCDRNNSPPTSASSFLSSVRRVSSTPTRRRVSTATSASNVLVSIQDGRAVPRSSTSAWPSTGSSSPTRRCTLGSAHRSAHPIHESGAGRDDRPGRRHAHRRLHAGVMLYECWWSAAVRGAGAAARRALRRSWRRIREESPPKPSARLSAMGSGLQRPRSVGCRPLDAAAELCGDLGLDHDEGVEKDRVRRYGSPQELAEDLRRHRAARAGGAGSARHVYRARKFRAARDRRARLRGACWVGRLRGGMTCRRDVSRTSGDRATHEAEARAYVSGVPGGPFTVSDRAEGTGISSRPDLPVAPSESRDPAPGSQRPDAVAPASRVHTVTALQELRDVARAPPRGWPGRARARYVPPHGHRHREGDQPTGRPRDEHAVLCRPRELPAPDTTVPADRATTGSCPPMRPEILASSLREP